MFGAVAGIVLVSLDALLLHPTGRAVGWTAASIEGGLHGGATANAGNRNAWHPSERRCIPFARLAAGSTAAGITIRLDPACCVLGECAASQEIRVRATGQRGAAVQSERLAVLVGSHTVPVSRVDAEMDEGASTKVALHAAPGRLVFQCADPAIRRQLFAAHGLSV